MDINSSNVSLADYLKTFKIIKYKYFLKISKFKKNQNFILINHFDLFLIMS